jgi:hypothetical protein
MRTRELAVVSIHPDRSEPLGVDLKHILAALEGSLGAWVWCVKNLDWLGEDGESLCQAVEAAGPDGLWIDSNELREYVGRIYQTIEGEFLAFPKSIDRQRLDGNDVDLSSFPTSKAVVAIVAVDGCYFDVYSKDPGVTASLVEGLQNVRLENPDQYF